MANAAAPAAAIAGEGAMVPVCVINVRTVMSRGATHMKHDWDLEPGTTVEAFQETLSGAKWQWRRSDPPVPAAYIISTLEQDEVPLRPGTEIVDGATYKVRISPKTKVGKGSDHAEKDVPVVEKSKLGRPSIPIPAWMGENGTVLSVGQYEEGEKLLVRIKTAKTRAKKDQDDAEYQRLTYLSASARERMDLYKKNNPQEFKKTAKSRKLKLQAKLDRFSLEMGREIDALAERAYGSQEDDENHADGSQEDEDEDEDKVELAKKKPRTK